MENHRNQTFLICGPCRFSGGPFADLLSLECSLCSCLFNLKSSTVININQVPWKMESTNLNFFQSNSKSPQRLCYPKALLPTNIFKELKIWDKITTMKPHWNIEILLMEEMPPVDMVNISLFIGFYTFQTVVVLDFWTINRIYQIFKWKIAGAW